MPITKLSFLGELFLLELVFFPPFIILERYRCIRVKFDKEYNIKMQAGMMYDCLC